MRRLFACATSLLIGTGLAAQSGTDAPGLCLTLRGTSPEGDPVVDARTVRTVALYVPRGERPSSKLAADTPFEAEWRGRFSLAQRDRYTFRADGEGTVAFSIDGDEVLGGQLISGSAPLVGEALRLRKGEHEIVVRYSSLPGSDRAWLRLGWSSRRFAIERLRDEVELPIVYVSHSLDEVIRLADTMVLLSDGAVVASGGVEELMSRLDLRPLTGRYEAGAVLNVEVAEPNADFGLTRLEFHGNNLYVPRLELPAGTSMRVRIRARDVALSLQRPADISILNVFAGTVAAIEDAEDGPQVDVMVDVGTPVVARITRKSLADLGLAVGKPVHALVKAVAIDRHNLGWRGVERRRPK